MALVSPTPDRRLRLHPDSAGELPPSDRQCLGQRVAEKTGLSPGEAERRATDIFTKLKQAADEARKASAALALWLVVSLFVGAFVASSALGSRRADSHHHPDRADSVASKPTNS